MRPVPGTRTGSARPLELHDQRRFGRIKHGKGATLKAVLAQAIQEQKRR